MGDSLIPFNNLSPITRESLSSGKLLEKNKENINIIHGNIFVFNVFILLYQTMGSCFGPRIVCHDGKTLDPGVQKFLNESEMDLGGGKWQQGMSKYCPLIKEWNVQKLDLCRAVFR